MTKDQLIECLKISGRYQVYSDGKGGYKVLPLRDDQVLITRQSHAEMSSAEPPEVIYNNQTG
jgi:hypothetical protein